MGASRLRVHALIDTLSVAGAEILLAEYGAVAALDGIDLTVGYLKATEGDLAAERLRAAGIEPELVGIPARLVVALRRVRRHLARNRPQVVHTHLGYADLLGAPAASSLRMPVISTVHSHMWHGGGREGVKLRLMAQARRRCATRVVTVSDSARDAYLAAGWDRPEHVVTCESGSRWRGVIFGKDAMRGRGG